jgi:hypothetical protein
MTFETVTLCLLILGPVNLGRLHLLAPLGLWLTVAIALASAVEYYLRFGPTVLAKDP